MKKITSIFLVLVMLSLLSIGANAALVDITSDAWYADGSYFCAYNGITTSSSSDTYYYPHDNANRGYSIYGVTHALGLNLSNTVNTGFTDVPNGSIYAGSVKWAVDNGVTSGVGGNLFGLTDLVTREQFCVFVYNSCATLGITLPNYRTYSSSDFSDAADIHSWATTAVQQMYEAELISGYNTGEMGPRDNISRGQISTILFKLYFLANHNGNKINVFVRSKTGVPLSNASVYLYYYNTNTPYDKYPESRVATNSKGIASISSTTPYQYAINTFHSGYMQGVSDSFITRSVYPETIVMETRRGAFKPPFKDFNPHTYWSSTRNYLERCQNFGYRYGVSSQYEFHQGIDIGKATGTNVFNISNGEVTMAGWVNGGYGNVVQVKSGTGTGETYITYQHLNQVKVSKNQTVSVVSDNYDSTSDDIIGTVGSTGGNYSPHLHISFSTSEAITLSSRDYFDPIGSLRYYDSSSETFKLVDPFN